MRVFNCPRSDEVGKFQGLVQAFPSIWNGRVLDVGCRSKSLGQQLSNGDIIYCGLDLRTPADLIADLDRGLPFDDEAFDLVVALDVLEHTDGIHKAFGELCRVCRKFVVIMLPNAYEISLRIRFLFGRPLSGKYGLPNEPVEDRHRWLFSLHEARAFTHSIGSRRGFKVAAEGCLIGPRRGFGIGRAMVSISPNLLSPWYLALLKRETDQR